MVINFLELAAVVQSKIGPQVADGNKTSVTWVKREKEMRLKIFHVKGRCWGREGGGGG